jgi:hypothetical protein
MLHKPLWLEAMPGNRGYLCLDCVERRLARPLLEADFAITPSEMQRGGMMMLNVVGPTPSDVRQRELEDWRDHMRRTGWPPPLSNEQRAARDAWMRRRTA